MFYKILRQRHWAILWTSQVLSAIGDNLYIIALMWLAVRMAGGRAGFVAAASAVSMLVCGLLGGVFADRWDRRRTMIGADLVRAVATATLPITALFSDLSLWHLTAVAVVLGGLNALFDPALQASLPALAGDVRTLQSANGLMDVTRRLAKAIGPSLAGLLTALLPITHFFTIDALSFGISAFAVYSLGTRFRWKPAASRRRVPGLRGVTTEIGEAMRSLRGHRPLVWGIFSHAVSTTAWGPAFILGAPLLTERVLHAGAGAYGLIVGAYGVGNVLSNLVVASIVIRRRVLVLFSGNIVLGLGFLVVAASTSLPMAIAGSALAAVGGPMCDITELTMIQTDMPSNQIGKVYSLKMLISSLGNSLGLALSGALFALVSVPAGIALCALVMITSGLAGLARFGFTEPAVPLRPSVPEISGHD